jgi:hypothetical protein
MEEITPRKAAQLLGISLASIYRHLKAGILPGIPRKGGVRIHLKDLAKVAASGGEPVGSTVRKGAKS